MTEAQNPASAKNVPGAPALFSTFLMGLASATLIELGVMEDPNSKQKRLNHEAARQHIELLAVLQEKTRGNLTKNEKDLLDRVLTDLRMEFAKLSGASKPSPSGDSVK